LPERHIVLVESGAKPVEMRELFGGRLLGRCFRQVLKLRRGQLFRRYGTVQLHKLLGRVLRPCHRLFELRELRRGPLRVFLPPDRVHRLRCWLQSARG